MVSGKFMVRAAITRMVERTLWMPETEPASPPKPVREEPGPGPRRETPVPKPQRKDDPFNPDWPKTRPTPEPKAGVEQ
jgi:hypothetical protein